MSVTMAGIEIWSSDFLRTGEECIYIFYLIGHITGYIIIIIILVFISSIYNQFQLAKNRLLLMKETFIKELFIKSHTFISALWRLMRYGVK